MSEIKVNKISPKQTCTQLTLGDSGDTIIIPAGATITNSGTATGFGPTGAVSWDTTPKTTTVTAVSGTGYFINTTSGGVTVNLPAGSAGSIVALSDYAATWNTNAVTVNANGTEKIGGIASAPATLNTRGQAVTLVYVDSTQGWTNVGDATRVAGAAYVAATGGTILTCGDYKTHVFTGPGTFTVTNAGSPAGSNSVEYLVVAGGGGGGGGGVVGAQGGGGGGGAGGFRQNYPSPTTAGLPVTVTAYPISIGSGGTGGQNYSTSSTQGTSSIFSTITSTGGGNGGNAYAYPNYAPAPVGDKNTGGSGGSGGGGGATDNPSYGNGGSGNTPPVNPSQGNSGGRGAPSSYFSGGGGGGASAIGAAATPTGGAGAGGAGSPIATAFFGPTSPSYGTPGPAPGRYFAGGGGGGNTLSPPNGGAGGGGSGPSESSPTGVDGSAGTINTGGGGGGAKSETYTGGAGGSGIVVIRYKFQ